MSRSRSDRTSYYREREPEIGHILGTSLQLGLPAATQKMTSNVEVKRPLLHKTVLLRTPHRCNALKNTSFLRNVFVKREWKKGPRIWFGKVTHMVRKINLQLWCETALGAQNRFTANSPPL